MRAGRKTEAETGKTRSCIVYLKNLGTGTPAGPAENSGGETKNLRSCKKVTNVKSGGGAAPAPASSSSTSTRGAKTSQSVPTKLSNVNQVNLEIATPVERRQSTRREVAIRERGQPVRGGATTPAEAQRSRSAGKGASPTRAKPLPTTPAAKTPKRDREKEREKPVSIRRRNTTVTSPQPAAKLSQRRITQNDGGAAAAAAGGGGGGQSAAKSKMFKQAKMMASSSSQSSLSSPPTIAASRSRRSIKPNPKYASDDVVTPKYMVSLAHESGHSRSGGGAKQLLATRDDDEMIEIDEDRNDVEDEDDEEEEEEEEEDNDDEVTDAAFNPHLHKSDEDDDDEDDLSDLEFQREIRPPPVKRGRGRPPKAGNTSATKTTTMQAISASVSSPSTVRTAGSSTQRNNVHQLRRSIATNVNKSKVAAAASLTTATTPGNKRKLEDPGESAVVRKRVALNGAANTKAGTPTAASQSTPKTNKATSGGAGAVRIVQAPQSVGGKQRLSQGQSFKINQAARAGSGAAAATPRSSSSQQMRVPPAPPAGPAESDDVPTFTIVNIDDIINQDDVLISRSSQSAASPTATTTAATTMSSNKAAKQISPLSRGAKMQTRRGGAGGQSSTSITTPQTPATPNTNQTTTKRMITVGQVGGAKSRPRILNAEMGKKAPAMKPLMSMGKELCNIDTEEEEEERDHDDDDDTDNVVQEKQPAKAAAVKKISIRGATGGGAANRLTSSSSPSQKPQQKWLSSTQQPTPTRNVLSTTANNRAAGGAGGISSGQGDRKLAKFLGEGNDELLFKKPQQQQRLKENAADNSPSKKEETTTMTKYLPAETTTICEEDGRMIKKITCYETWHVIGSPVRAGADNSASEGGGANSDNFSRKPQVQRTSLELPLVKLANLAGRIKVPSNKWSSKITLYKVSPTLMARQTMTIFTGDLKSFNIPEEERHKYQPSCVLFRRLVLDRTKCRVPYDRAIIFKNKCFYANIDGKHINLMGAPEAVSSVKDVEILLDIVDRLSLSSSLVETVNGK